jgi:hypothetical protein
MIPIANARAASENLSFSMFISTDFEIGFSATCRRIKALRAWVTLSTIMLSFLDNREKAPLKNSTLISCNKSRFF